MDTSWDNSGLPPERKGLSTGAKVALGCGGVLVLGVLLVLVGGAVFARASLRRPEVQAEAGRALHPLLHQVTVDLQKDETALALYRRNPGLAAPYPTEAAFLAATTPWRAQLGLLPDTPPEAGAFHLDMRFLGASRVALRLPDGTWFRATLVRRDRRRRREGARELPLAHLEVVKEP